MDFDPFCRSGARKCDGMRERDHAGVTECWIGLCSLTPPGGAGRGLGRGAPRSRMIVFLLVYIKPFLVILHLFPAIVSQDGGVPDDCSHGSFRRQRMRSWVVPLSSRSLWQLIIRALRHAAVAMGKCVCVCGGRPVVCKRVERAGTPAASV